MRHFTQELIFLLGFALAIPESTCAASRSGDSCCLKETAPACCCSESVKASREEPANHSHSCACQIKSPRKGETPAGIPKAMATARVQALSTSPAERKSFQEPYFGVIRFERGTSLHSPPRLRLAMQQRFLI